MAQDLVSRQQRHLAQLIESNYTAVRVTGNSHSNLAAKAACWFGRHNFYGLEEMNIGLYIGCTITGRFRTRFGEACVDILGTWIDICSTLVDKELSIYMRPVSLSTEI
jgi:hypothetical protein